MYKVLYQHNLCRGFMSGSIHGHQVMEMMLEQGEPLTPAALKARMQAKFGAEARYHTCSAQNMNADELLIFLENKGKFIHCDTGVTTTAQHICGH